MNRLMLGIWHVLLAAAWLALGCSSAAWSQEKVTLRLDFIPNGYHGPFYMALDKGYYRQEGLDVQINRGFGSVDTLKRVASGGDTFGFADLYTAVKGIAEGIPVRAVGAGLGDAVGCIVALKKSGIRNIKDLEGRSLASGAGASPLVQLPSLFQAAGVDMKKVNVVLMDIVVKASALINGKVDSMVCITPSEPPALTAQGQDLVVFEYRNYLNISGSGIFASNDTIRTKPELIRKFLRATYRGAQDFARDVNGASALLAKYHPEGNAEIYLGQAKAGFPLWVTPVAREHGYGWMDEVKMRNTLNQAVGDFKLEKKLAAGEFYTNEFVPVPAIK